VYVPEVGVGLPTFGTAMTQPCAMAIPMCDKPPDGKKGFYVGVLQPQHDMFVVYRDGVTDSYWLQNTVTEEIQKIIRPPANEEWQVQTDERGFAYLEAESESQWCIYQTVKCFVSDPTTIVLTLLVKLRS